MRDEEIDRVLLSEERLDPSPGFAASVMEAARAEAATPPPMPFPWIQALPGLAAGCAALGALAVSLLRGSAAPRPLPWLTDSTRDLASLLAGPETAWLLVALFLTLATVRLALRLASYRVS